MRKSIFTLLALLTAVLPSAAQTETYSAVPKAHKQVVKSERRATMIPVHKQANKVQADLSLFQGLKLYAALSNSDNWAGASIGSVPYGVYSFTIGEDRDFQAIYTDLSFNFMASAMGRDMLVGVRPMEVFGYLNGVEYNGLDSMDFRQVWSQVYDESGNYSYIPSVMAYDVTSDITYSAQYNADLSGLNWAKWNPKTRHFDVLHKWNNDFQPLAMAATPDGTMYCIGGDGFFYQIDKTNGDASMIAQLSTKPTLYVQSMTYEPTSKHFVWLAVSNAGSAIYAVNPEDGELTLIRQLSKNEQASSIFFKGNAAPAKAPAMAENLKFAYSDNGSLQGNITFTIPTKAFDGTSLGGKVKMSVWLDGQVLAENSEVTTGSNQTFAFNVTNDNHYVDVVLQNDNGFSPHAYKYEYAGYDIPLAVSDVILNVEEGQANLTWNAPVGGENNGYIDFEHLTYNITRMPDNVNVANNHQGTTFSETLPEKMERYYYIVSAKNGEGKEGVGTESNRILTGSAFQTPYYDDFDDEATISLWTVINVDNDKSDYGTEYTWNYNTYNKDFAINTGSWAMGEGLDGVNDYLVSPGIELKAGITYAMIANMRNTFQGTKERVSLLVGTDPNDISTFREIAKNDEYDVMADGQGPIGRDWEADFQVESDGVYYMVIQARTLREDNASGIFVEALSVEQLGKNGAPAEVQDLTVTPEAEGEMEAVVSFKLPNTTLGGDNLTGNITANIYRDDTEVAKLDYKAAGSLINWTDNTVEGVGVHKYTVSATNDEGEGKRISTKQFIGVYTAPYVNNFDDETTDDFFVTVNDSVSGGNKCVWEWSQYNQNLALGYYIQKNYEPIWLFFPAIKFDANEVYEVNFDWSYAPFTITSPASFGYGMAADSTAQTLINDLPYTNDLGYGNAYASSNEIVATQTGKYYPSIFINGNRGDYGSYITPTIDNLNIVHIASAFAPYQVENLVAEHDMTGAMKATLHFDAPTTDFAKRALVGKFNINIYRTGQTIPVKTFENVDPGQSLEWIDEQPLNGNNSYTVVPMNDYGRGKAATVETFVGIDVPEAVTNYLVRGNEDNQKAILSWDAASEVGQNGGVVDESLIYTIVEFFPNETEQDKQLKILSTTKDLTFTVEHEATDNMEQHFYGVITQTSAGVGKAVLDYVILGKLKEVPFTESFVNGGLSTDGWVAAGDVNQYGAAWQMVQDSEEQTSQDGDNGFALCYNGNMYEQYHYGDLITPKMQVEPTKDYTLTFYVYHGTASTSTIKPTLVTSLSLDDYEFVDICDTISVTEGEKEWVKYEIPLKGTSLSNYMKFRFRAFLSSMSERVWIDNIVVESKTAAGIERIFGEAGVHAVKGGISVIGYEGQQVQVFTVDGRLIDNFRASGNDIRSYASGVYILKVNGMTTKLTVK